MIIGDRLVKLGLKSGLLSIEGTSEEDINPASLDMSFPKDMGVYKISKLFNNPSKKNLDRYASFRGTLEDIVLEKEELYLLGGQEVRLPEGLGGRFDTRSTAGRLGIWADLLYRSPEKKNNHFINMLPQGFSGNVFFRVEPQIPLKFKEGDSIGQMRFFDSSQEGPLSSEVLHRRYGKPSSNYLKETEAVNPLTKEPVEEIRDKMGLYNILEGAEEELVPEEEAIVGNRTIFTVNTRKAAVLESDIVEPIKYWKKESADPHNYWNFVEKDKGEPLEIEKDEFTLVSTQEIVDTTDYCWTLERIADIVAKYIEVHRAGFGDPGFKGPVTLELMNSNRTMEIYPHQVIAKTKWKPVLWCENMYEGSYQGQPVSYPTLPKQFKNYDKMESLFMEDL